jgi:hypothetical protein
MPSCSKVQLAVEKKIIHTPLYPGHQSQAADSPFVYDTQLRQLKLMPELSASQIAALIAMEGTDTLRFEV